MGTLMAQLTCAYVIIGEFACVSVEVYICVFV
jgi:hypothetical protein